MSNSIRVALPGGGFLELPSVDDAARFYQQISGNTPVQSAPISHGTNGANGNRKTSSRVLAFVKKLAEHPDGVENIAVAQTLGIGKRGMGPVVSGFVRFVAPLGLTKAQAFKKWTTDDGHKMFQLRPAAIEALRAKGIL
jgi:hypothetical protein